MAEPAHGTPVTTEILATLPLGVDPLALSLNESPFPPLPAVRSALIHCLDAANRYPEFLLNSCDGWSPTGSGSAKSKSSLGPARRAW